MLTPKAEDISSAFVIIGKYKVDDLEKLVLETIEAGMPMEGSADKAE